MNDILRYYNERGVRLSPDDIMFLVKDGYNPKKVFLGYDSGEINNV